MLDTVVILVVWLGGTGLIAYGVRWTHQRRTWGRKYSLKLLLAAYVPWVMLFGIGYAVGNATGVCAVAMGMLGFYAVVMQRGSRQEQWHPLRTVGNVLVTVAQAQGMLLNKAADFFDPEENQPRTEQPTGSDASEIEAEPPDHDTQFLGLHALPTLPPEPQPAVSADGFSTPSLYGPGEANA